MSRLVKVYENLNSLTDRHGKTRHYFRAKGRKSIPVKGEFGSHEFDANYEAAKAAAVGVALPGETRIQKGTVHDLCAQYYQCYDFKTNKEKTQKRYRAQIEVFRQALGHIMVRAINSAHIEKIKAAYADRPGAGRTLLKRLRGMFAFAIKAGFRTDNPCSVVKLPKEGKGFLPWSDDDIAIYEAHWAAGTRERLGMYLCLYTAQRRSDIVTMGRQHLRDGEISVFQQKTGTRVWIPLHSKLREELAQVPENQMLFMVNPTTGKMLSSEGFGNWIRKNAKAPMRAEAYEGEPEADRQLIPGTRGPHGLRKAACRQLIEMGCDGETVISISGHATVAELEPYIRDVNRRKKARQAMKIWDVGTAG
jgi:integrase